MKKYLLVLIALFGIAVASGQEKNKMFYVGTFTSEGAEGIYLCGFNAETSEISLLNTFRGIDDPSFLKVSPNKKYLYVASRANKEVEKSGGYVSAYRIDATGDIHFLNKQVSNGFGPCHVDVSPNGDYVAIATYTSGTTSLYPVVENGFLRSASSIIKNQGSSINKDRQDGPHAHSIKFSPYNNEVYSADLGTDQLNIFQLKNKKLIKPKQEFVKLSAGAGPRHFAMNGSNIIYVINELSSTIAVLKNNNGKWDMIQEVSTLPAGFDGKSYCADIHISADGRFLYGSNRGHNSIAVFNVVSGTKKIEFKGTVPVEGDWPRNFALTPDGEFMLVANQKSGNITVFKIDEKNGMPVYTGKELRLPAPVCIDFL